MTQTHEERLESKRASYAKWAAKNPDYFRNRRDVRRAAEQERDRRRRSRPDRKECNRKYKANREARLRAAFVERVDAAVLFQRDGYICQLCGIECPRDAKVPAPNAPTVDHVVPIAKGGLHSYENTQCLCFECNCKKGDQLPSASKERLAS